MRIVDSILMELDQEAQSHPAFEPSGTRHLITTRLTYRLLRQTLTASLFAFASPTMRTCTYGPRCPTRGATYSPSREARTSWREATPPFSDNSRGAQMCISGRGTVSRRLGAQSPCWSPAAR